MTRADFERMEAQSRHKTVELMREQGFYSAVDPAPGSCGWQTFGIPPDATRREHQDTLRQFTEPDNLHPQRYGEDDQ